MTEPRDQEEMRTGAIQIAARDRLDFEDLRPGQKEAVKALLSGRDTLAVLPTGSGKSAIYQLAAELLDGPTVVVSPLIALQQDQVRSLAGHDVGDAAASNSTLAAGERREHLARFRDGDLRYLFLAPEQLLRDDTAEALRGADVALFVVDEAHCISDWGHDFRPAYLRLGAIVDELGHPPVLALTATAAPPVRREIVDRLHMHDPVVVVRGFDRPNIHLSVERFLEDDDRRDRVVDAVVSAEGPGILYVPTRRDAERYAHVLAETGMRSAHYHGGLSAADRRAAHEAFIADELDVIVATPAFGMGIDKPNVRFVFHSSVPASLDSYYQEVGRAGRDGEPSRAVLFHRDEDLGLRRYLNAGGGVDGDDLAAVAEALTGHAAPRRELSDLADATGLSRQKTTIALSRLEEQQVVRLLTGDRVEVTGEADSLHVAATAAADEVEARSDYEESRLEMVRTYTDTTQCRGRYLVNYYGEQMDDVCRHCDNCAAGTAVGEIPDDVPFDVEARVRHPKWGDGTVVRYEQDRMTVMFDEAGYRTLSLDVVTDRDLLTPI